VAFFGQDRVSIALLAGLVALVAGGAMVDGKRRSQAAAHAALEDKARKARRLTVEILPWIDRRCGIGHDLPVCDRRAWPGGVYPTEPIEDETTRGIVWVCGNYVQRDYGRERFCTATASPERRAKYPCHPVAGDCLGGPQAFRRLAIGKDWGYALRR
jgi:hypothetical protein